jgi:uncharacterized small protein (DUF1192 family)
VTAMRAEVGRNESLSQGELDKAVTALRAEAERQRATTAKREAEAEVRLGEVAEQASRQAEVRVRVETERLLDQLLREIRAIGEQPAG